GAEFLHVVDLDGAKDGGRPNEEVIQRIIGETSLRVEVGGGVRDEESVRTYLDAGAFRVILGTAAAENEEFTRDMCEKYGERIVVGADARDGVIAVRGWLGTSGEELFDFVKRMGSLGVGTVIVTDISRDGEKKGANLDLYRKMTAELRVGIVASGGIASVSDIKALAAAGVEGAILGRALYVGEITLADALAAAEVTA
ncbi:MAG: 1-(5-phosphoribosyl)-5-((5-phosphoribosylamino)methylideneamino)imidazole-4-carboxamide isomerase, partial [Clostridia bacterium]|nr:1-(5-phosphoribosyl)-5-((5-phosphoribosylamino)methylideneamino)imidazole-4-carboxamide isomerase [Clostridia bacterium]